jgi:hypothetical protein
MYGYEMDGIASNWRTGTGVEGLNRIVENENEYGMEWDSM